MGSDELGLQPAHSCYNINGPPESLISDCKAQTHNRVRHGKVEEMLVSRVQKRDPAHFLF